MTHRSRHWIIRTGSLLGLLLLGLLALPYLPATYRQMDGSNQEGVVRAAPHFQEALALTPEVLPAGQVNVPYQQVISAVGGVGQVQVGVEGLLPQGLEFTVGADGITISGTVTEPGIAEITAFAEDSAGNTAQRTYTISFTETGEVVLPTPTPDLLTIEDIQQTRVAGARQLLGEAEVEVSDEIDALAIRTGPYTGASLRNLAFPGDRYTVLGRLRPVGSRYNWYLIDYTRQDPLNPDLPAIPRQGWVSGRFADVSGFLPDIPTLQNPFDNLGTATTGVRGRSILRSNIYQYPGGYTPLVTRFDEGSTFEILGRTVLDRRNFTYWILIRLDRGGAVGWTRYTPFIDIDGNIDDLPLY